MIDLELLFILVQRILNWLTIKGAEIRNGKINDLYQVYKLYYFLSRTL